MRTNKTADQSALDPRLLRAIAISLPAVLIAAGSAVAAPALPKNITSQLPAGYAVKSFLRGLLDGDDKPDYLVAIHKPGEREAMQRGEKQAGRPILIFVQQPDGNFKLAARNDRVAFAIDEGGQCDPFDGEEESLAIRNRYFTVQNNVACGAHWTDYMTFRWDAQQGTWLFHKRIAESWGLNPKPDGEALVREYRRVTNAAPGAPVSFETFRPR